MTWPHTVTTFYFIFPASLQLCHRRLTVVGMYERYALLLLFTIPFFGLNSHIPFSTSIIVICSWGAAYSFIGLTDTNIWARFLQFMIEEAYATNSFGILKNDFIEVSREKGFQILFTLSIMLGYCVQHIIHKPLNCLIYSCEYIVAVNFCTLSRWSDLLWWTIVSYLSLQKWSPRALSWSQ